MSNIRELMDITPDWMIKAFAGVVTGDTWLFSRSIAEFADEIGLDRKVAGVYVRAGHQRAQRLVEKVDYDPIDWE